MKSVIILFPALLLCNLALSQDTLYTRQGILEGKVVEIGTAEIRYIRSTNLDGPVYVLKKKEVSMIRYRNGTSDFFTPGQSTFNTAANSQPGSSQLVNNSLPAISSPASGAKAVVVSALPYLLLGAINWALDNLGSGNPGNFYSRCTQPVNSSGTYISGQ